MPPPDALEHYDAVLPGAADRILRMAEREQAARLQMQEISVPAAVRESDRGQYLGFVLALCAIVGAVWTALAGAHPVVPVALVGLPLASIVKSIRDAQKQARAEREQHADQQ